MRALILSFCMFALSPLLWGVDAIKDFTKDLSKAQRGLLNDFLVTLSESSAGYVLYGDKPMSIEIFDLSAVNTITNPDARTISLLKGREMWEDLRLSCENKEYILTTFESGPNCNIVCINRKAFLQTVDENITLFKYALGPNVSSDELLKELVSSGKQFYEVLKNNRVLLEVLLGYGKQNAILHSRLVNIADNASFGENEEFPLISKKLSRAWAASSAKFLKQPSFGFDSIDDEEAVLAKLTVDSAKLKSFNGLPIPSFECDPALEETKELLTIYEQNRSKLIKAISGKTFLDDTLRKLFTSTDGIVEIPSIPKQRELALPASKEETTKKLVEIIQKKIALEPHGIKKFQTAFLQGVAAREKGKQLPIPFQMKRNSDISAIQREIECCKNLERANAYFSRLGSREDLVALVPNEIFYKILKTGKENPVTSKVNKVSFQYSFQILGDPKSKDWGIVKDENISAIIPGIAYAFVGMQRGEERVVYIHPRHAYGEDTFYPPNVAVVAQVRLLDFKEGDQAVAIYPPHQLEERDYKDLLAKFEVLRGEEFYDQGVEFWDTIKKCGDFLDFQTFQNIYSNHQPDHQSSFLNLGQLERFVVDLEYYLLSLQKRS